MRSERVLIYLPHGVIRDYLVSYYVSATSKQLAINAFCTGESAMIFLNSPRKRTGSALEINMSTAVI